MVLSHFLLAAATNSKDGMYCNLKKSETEKKNKNLQFMPAKTHWMSSPQLACKKCYACDPWQSVLTLPSFLSETTKTIVTLPL